jgi:hypothetical protein
MAGNEDDMDLWTWIKQVIDGEDYQIIVMDRKGNDKFRFNLTGAWPSIWLLGKLESHSGSLLFEELVLSMRTQMFLNISFFQYTKKEELKTEFFALQSHFMC